MPGLLFCKHLFFPHEGIARSLLGLSLGAVDFAALPFPVKYARHVLPSPTPAPRSLPLPPIVQGAAVWLQQLTAPEWPCPKGWAHTRPLCALSAESGESDSCFRGDKGLCSIRVPLWPEQLFLWRGFSPPVSSSDSFRQHLNPHSPVSCERF